MKREKSAGGLVLKNLSSHPKILMIRVRNLEGKIVWTFPKGHLEKGETNDEAALREVEEETGWKCEIKELKKIKGIFKKVSYRFLRDGLLVQKEVVWFLMNPIVRRGKRDCKEVLKADWFDLKKAKEMVLYPSDLTLLATLEDYNRRRQQ